MITLHRCWTCGTTANLTADEHGGAGQTDEGEDQDDREEDHKQAIARPAIPRIAKLTDYCSTQKKPP